MSEDEKSDEKMLLLIIAGVLEAIHKHAMKKYGWQMKYPVNISENPMQDHKRKNQFGDNTS